MGGGQTNEFRSLILVTEDDDSNFKLIKATIGERCDIQWTENDEEVVALFKGYGNETKAILMDIKMPVMNGLDAMEIICGENKEIPIIMQTTYASSSDKENAVNAGASGVLVKPITLSILRDVLTKYFPELVWQTDLFFHPVD